MAHGFISPFSLDSRLVAESRRVIEESRRLLAETEPMTRPPYSRRVNSKPDDSSPPATIQDADGTDGTCRSRSDGEALVLASHQDDDSRKR